VKYLAEGTWEIVNQPSEGFIKGPIEGAIGIGKGGVYFLRNVIAGTFNSFEVISESCSRGLASITYDEKFITRREKIQMQKSKQFVQGTKSALWALFTGFEVAITGIVRHPTEERKKIGTAGIFKGLAIGLAGLITKPMSGLFEAISKFSEGVKQTALFYQDGPNITRSRPPRVFISDQQYYTDYNM
jgi:vacuolar protein sorting-associated protein 13A/C